jgi:hypothetical protein
VAVVAAHTLVSYGFYGMGGHIPCLASSVSALAILLVAQSAKVVGESSDSRSEDVIWCACCCTAAADNSMRVLAARRPPADGY